MSFPETRWSMLALATAHGDERAMKVMGDLCQRYWQPVFAAIHRRETCVETARDLTQAFFVYLLEKSTLRRADRTRGRFRTFLLTVLWRFLSDEHRRNTAEKRGGYRKDCALEEVEHELMADENPLVETLDREWALAILERALASVEKEIVATRSAEVWKVLRSFLPGSSEALSISAASAVLNVSEGAARIEIHRLRNRCRAALRREVMATLSSPEDLEEEITHLGRALRTASAAIS